MIHVKQKDGMSSCGACAYAAILGLSELQGIRECSTDFRRGTFIYNVMTAFEKRGINTFKIDCGDKLKNLWWLPALSSHFPLYVVVPEGNSRHAVAIADSLVYDGKEDAPLPLEVYSQKKILDILVIDHELQSFGKPE